MELCLRLKCQGRTLSWGALGASQAARLDGCRLVSGGGAGATDLRGFEGYCDSVLIEAWFEQQLCQVLRAGQVVILDNASFHRHQRLRQLLAKVGCSLLPLPGYSPDLNKVEPLWHTLKSRISRIAHSGDQHATFREAVDAAFM